MSNTSTSQANQLLTSLGEIISNINTFTTIPELLNYLQTVLHNTLGTNSVWLFIVHDDHPLKFKLISASGSAAQHGFDNFREFDATDDVMIQTVLASDKPLYVKNALTHPTTDKRIVEQSGARSLLNCRVTVDHQVVGILGTGTHFDEGHIDLSQEQIAFFTAITQAVGICLDKFAHQKDAQLDSLTQVFNRIGLRSRADKLLSLSKRHFKKLALLYFDLDNFKPINDTYGHHVGDKALKAFANCLMSCVRSADIVARVGGDEFVVLLSDIKCESDVDRLLHNLMDKTATPLIDDMAQPLLYSVGCAFYPDECGTIDELIRVADSKMYCKKVTAKPVKKTI